MLLNHGGEDASPWVRRWSHLVPTHGTVLDVACGYGRHLRWFAARGHPVVGVDRSADALQALADLGAEGGVELVQADIENGPWPWPAGNGQRRFDAVIVTNYLWRPLLPTLLASLAPGGLLLYETFAAGNASVGKPARPDFLLANGELLDLCKDLRVVAYEDGFCETPARFVQRIAAVAPARQSLPSPETPPRYLL